MDIRAEIQADNYNKVENFLLERMKEQDYAAFEICRDTTADRARIDWWTEMCAEISKVADEKCQVDAIGLDLSSYIDPPAGMPMNPAVEITCYSDRPDMQFSTASLENLYSASENYSAPWTGRFNEACTTQLIDGLGDLTAYILENDNSEDVWASYFLLLRFHQKIRETTKEVGLPFHMKVLLGVHGFSPWLTTIVTDPQVAPLSRDQLRLSQRPALHPLTPQYIELLHSLFLIELQPAELREPSTEQVRQKLIAKTQEVSPSVLQNTPYRHVRPWTLGETDLERFIDVLNEFSSPHRRPDDPVPTFQAKRRGFFV